MHWYSFSEFGHVCLEVGFLWYFLRDMEGSPWGSAIFRPCPTSPIFFAGNVWLVGGLEHDFYDFPYIGNNHPPTRWHLAILAEFIAGQTDHNWELKRDRETAMCWGRLVGPMENPQNPSGQFRRVKCWEYQWINEITLFREGQPSSHLFCLFYDIYIQYIYIL